MWYVLACCGAPVLCMVVLDWGINWAMNKWA